MCIRDRDQIEGFRLDHRHRIAIPIDRRDHGVTGMSQSIFEVERHQRLILYDEQPIDQPLLAPKQHLCACPFATRVAHSRSPMSAHRFILFRSQPVPPPPYTVKPGRKSGPKKDSKSDTKGGAKFGAKDGAKPHFKAGPKRDDTGSKPYAKTDAKRGGNADSKPYGKPGARRGADAGSKPFGKPDGRRGADAGLSLIHI